MVNPFNPPRPITTPFGKPGSWAAGRHTGADIGAPEGTPMYAIAAGKVVEVGTTSWGAAYGDRSCIIQHANGHRMLYAHMSACAVKVGQQVKEGQLVGKCGNRGRSFGAHAHCELRRAPYRYNIDCLDPAPLMQGTAAPAKPPVPKYPGREAVEKVAKSGGKAPWVAELKKALKKRGLTGFAIDPVYGPGLKKAVAQVQKNKLKTEPNGVCGPWAWTYAFTGEVPKAATAKKPASKPPVKAPAKKPPVKRPAKKAAAKPSVTYAKMKGRVSAKEAVEWMQKQVDAKRGGYRGLCMKLCGNAYGYGYGSPSAAAFLAHAKSKGVKFSKDWSKAPIGAIILWDKSSYPYGHIAVFAGIATGNGAFPKGTPLMYTQDAAGVVVKTNVANSRWSSLPLAGWCDDSRIWATQGGTR